MKFVCEPQNLTVHFVSIKRLRKYTKQPWIKNNSEKVQSVNIGKNNSGNRWKVLHYLEEYGYLGYNDIRTSIDIQCKYN